MCGIAGKICFDGSLIRAEEIQRMSDALIHRGPDSEGIWIHDDRRVGFGHRRLAILDLSESGHQPMHYDGRLTITFNGEIYNYLELRDDLEKRGYIFTSQSDTEVILASYLHYGKACLDHFDGMFAFAIWDELKQELFLARDRFGEKPLYYFVNKMEFVFASEMKAIFATGVERRISDEMIFYYLAYDVVENPHEKNSTFYENIAQVPPGHYLIINRSGDMTISRYWDIDRSKSFPGSIKQATEEFRHLFDESIRIRLRSDVPVGSSFSGGIDSSSIVASILNQNPDKKLNTFTARFEDLDYDEGVFVQKMVDKYDFCANFCFPTENALTDELDKVFYHHEEPFLSTSMVAQWEVMKLAKQKGVTVLLDGQGADETIAGYYKYFAPFLMELYRSNGSEYRRQLDAVETNLERKYALSRSQKIYSKVPAVHRGINRIRGKSKLRAIANDISDDFFRSYERMEAPFAHHRSLDEALYFDTFNYGLGKLLKFADRNSMAFSREVRLPYLSHKLVEFVFSLPSKYRMNEGWSKYILRLSMEDILPREIAWRKDKKGFQAPSTWLDDPAVKDLANDSYNRLNEAGYVRSFENENSWKYIMINKLMTSAH